MRIAILAWESLHSVHVGGLGVVVTRMAEELAKKGHDVYLFTRAAEGQSKHAKINDVNYCRCKFDPGKDIVSFFSNMSKAIVKEFHAVVRHSGKFDIIHGHDWHVADALYELKKEGNLVVLSYHSSEYGRLGGTLSTQREFKEISAREGLGGRISDRIITVSRTMRKELCRLYKVPRKKVDIIPNAIAPRKYRKDVDPNKVKKKYGIPSFAPTVLFIGRLEYQKGPDLLIDAIPRVLENRADVKFLLAGRGTMGNYLRRRARKIGITGAVRFLGWIPYRRYVDLLNTCDIVCIPSRNEPFGIVLLEAWAAGRPVVATDVGGLGENIKNLVNGVKVRPRPKSIACGINYLFDHPRAMERVGVKGKEKVKRFNWTFLIKKLLKTYHRVLAGRATPFFPVKGLKSRRPKLQ